MRSPSGALRTSGPHRWPPQAGPSRTLTRQHPTFLSAQPLAAVNRMDASSVGE